MFLAWFKSSKLSKGTFLRETLKQNWVPKLAYCKVCNLSLPGSLEYCNTGMFLVRQGFQVSFKYIRFSCSGEIIIFSEPY